MVHGSLSVQYVRLCGQTIIHLISHLRPSNYTQFQMTLNERERTVECKAHLEDAAVTTSNPCSAAALLIYIGLMIVYVAKREAG